MATVQFSSVQFGPSPGSDVPSPHEKVREVEVIPEEVQDNFENEEETVLTESEELYHSYCEVQ